MIRRVVMFSIFTDGVREGGLHDVRPNQVDPPPDFWWFFDYEGAVAGRFRSLAEAMDWLRSPDSEGQCHRVELRPRLTIQWDRPGIADRTKTRPVPRKGDSQEPDIDGSYSNRGT